MALTDFQKYVCKILSNQRKQDGEAYIAGGAALNVWLETPRVSRDIDLFHDTAEAVEITWEKDKEELIRNGLSLHIVRQRPGFIETIVKQNDNTVRLQWTRDSAYRFFPLVLHDELGLTLHPYDLATNKVLAMVSRLEIRDWIYTIECDSKLQSLGYLLWAACGKDPGFTPAFILNEAKRSSRYSQEELLELEFIDSPPDIYYLHKQWKNMLQDAEHIIELLPEDKVGKCILASDGTIYKGSQQALIEDLKKDKIIFHQGRIGGAFPNVGVNGTC